MPNRFAFLMEPWLGRLLRQRSLCRGLAAASIFIGIGAWMGWRLWPCVVAELTGLPCPGCGLTRAITALARGDWPSAMRLHPFSPAILVIGILVSAGAFLPQKNVNSLATWIEKIERRTLITTILTVLLLSFGLTRMLGFWYQPPVSDGKSFLIERAMTPVKHRPTQSTSTLPQPHGP